MNREEEIRIGELIRAIPKHYRAPNLPFFTNFLGRVDRILDRGRGSFEKCDLYWSPSNGGYVIAKYGDQMGEYFIVSIYDLSGSDPLRYRRGTWVKQAILMAKEQGLYLGEIT